MLEYAKKELSKIAKDKDESQKMINNDILEIIEVFDKQGHTGFTASYTINVLERLLRGKPLTPLTGEDNEWGEETEFGSRLNKRCLSVFKTKDGKVFDSDSMRCSDNGGITWFSSHRFQKEITFPYFPPAHPEKVYIRYKKDVPLGFTSDEYEIITDKQEEIKKLYEQKRKEFDNR